MLIQFTMENHRSIREPVDIRFIASQDASPASYRIRPDGPTPLLPVLALCGANAAGKSNILHGIAAMWDMVAGSCSRLSRGQELPWEPFAGNRNPTSFEAVYFYNGIRYAYGFSFDAKRIHSESLFHWPQGRKTLIFSRQNGQYVFRENVAEQTALSRRTLDNRLYLVTSNDWNLPQTENAYLWFLGNVLVWKEPAPASSETAARIAQSETQRALVQEELLLADPGITHITAKPVPGKEGEYAITTTHQALDEEGRPELFQMRMEQESAGTQQYFAQLGIWLQALETGSLLLVDEEERSMHPLLTRHLVGKMQDPAINTHGAQLLFTSHDTLLPEPCFLRRDQLRLVEKDKKSGATSCHSIREIWPDLPGGKHPSVRSAVLDQP